MRLYGVTGWKNAGKTTLTERLVTELTARGFSVSTLKHAHHAFDVDQPGRDSHRHRQAGAREVLIASRNRWALMAELREAPEPSLAELAAKLSPVDLVLAEGWKREAHPKVEAWRAETGAALIGAADATIRLIAADLPEAAPAALGQPVRALDDVAGIADFILSDLGLPERADG